MSRAQFTRRLCALEAQSQPDPAHGWTPPAFPPGWYEEVLRLLQEYGYLEAVLRSLASSPHAEQWVCNEP
jgi:hypothetical protein